MKQLTLILLFLIPSFYFGQNEEDTTIYKIVEKMPEFPGGETKLYEYLSKSIKVPQCYALQPIKGRPYIQFIIEKDGSISNVKSLIYEKTKCKSNIIEVIQNMPKWTPSEQKGKKVRVKYTLPVIIHFK